MTAAPLLGAVLAGGQSRRFGSDKALALVDGKPLIAHALDLLRSWCACVVVVGRDWPGLARVEDHPGPGLGPLAGLCGALLHASAHGFGEVLAIPCDMPGLPPDLPERLSPGPAVVEGHWTIGLWPAGLGHALAARVSSGGPMSLRGFAEASGARPVAIAGLLNVNRPGDLPAARHGLSKMSRARLRPDTAKG